MSFAAAGFARFARTTKRAAFLSEMDSIVPWDRLCAVVEPHYPTGEGGRPAIALERMLRIYFLQQWFNLGDPTVEKALYDRRMALRDESAYRDGQQNAYRAFLLATPANVHDSHLLPELLHGEETRVWGDAAYRGQTAAIRLRAPAAADFTHRHSARREGLAKRERARHRSKARVRARVEHAFRVLKRIFGFAKVRYRGIAKNAHRLVINFALASLYLHRRRLLSQA